MLRGNCAKPKKPLCFLRTFVYLFVFFHISDSDELNRDAVLCVFVTAQVI